MRTPEEINEIITRTGIVPVIKLENPERDAENLAQALIKGDVPVAEVTFRADGADTAIRLMKTNFPDMLVGAGTVTTTEQIDKAIASGAEFVVSPGFDAELVEYAQKCNIAVFPGCITPSEYHQALKHNLSVIKFFPAEQSGGISTIKALSGPFSMFKVMPTGGISLSNLEKYISEPVIAACGGSFMVTSSLIKEQNWDKITSLCLEAREIVKKYR